MLNPKTQSFNSSGRGHESLSAFDVAASLAGANKLGVSTLLASIGGEKSVKPKEFAQMLERVRDMAESEGWRVKPDDEKVKTLLQIAIYAHCNKTACPKCKGTRYQPNQSEPCEKCRGVGDYSFTHQEKSDIMGISKSAWGKTWEDRYYSVQCIILEQERDAMQFIFKKLTNGT